MSNLSHKINVSDGGKYRFKVILNINTQIKINNVIYQWKLEVHLQSSYIEKYKEKYLNSESHSM
jgi:hypothetical protein